VAWRGRRGEGGGRRMEGGRGTAGFIKKRNVNQKRRDASARRRRYSYWFPWPGFAIK
jgi:hypothetical protein